MRDPIVRRPCCVVSRRFPNLSVCSSHFFALRYRAALSLALAFLRWYASGSVARDTARMGTSKCSITRSSSLSLCAVDEPVAPAKRLACACGRDSLWRTCARLGYWEPRYLAQTDL
jgi:hypothetical protein